MFANFVRAGQGLAAGFVIAGIAFAAPASAEDKSWDLEKYDSCMAFSGSVYECCIYSGGVILSGGDRVKCVAPAVSGNSVQPGGSTKASVSQVPLRPVLSAR